MTINIQANHIQREDEIRRLLTKAASRLPAPAEERNKEILFAEIVHRINQSYQRDEKDRALLNNKIKQLENRHWGITGTKYSNGAGYIVKGLSILVAVTGLIQLATEKLWFEADDDDNGGVERGLTIGFTVAVIASTILYGAGTTIHYFGKRALHKKLDYKELTWKEKKDLKKFIGFFNEIVDISSESDEEVLKYKLQHLLERIDELPAKYEEIPVFKDKDEVLSYLLLSLPSNHPIRKQLNNLDDFTEDRIDYENRSESDASQIDSESDEDSLGSEISPSRLPEPDITTFPRKRNDAYDSFRKVTIRRLSRGKPLEGYLLNVKPDQDENLSPEQERYLKHKFYLCNEWLDIESFLGCGVSYLLVNGKKIKRCKIFNEVDYKTFKEYLIQEDSSQESEEHYSESESYDIEAQQPREEEQRPWQSRLFEWLNRNPF